MPIPSARFPVALVEKCKTKVSAWLNELLADPDGSPSSARLGAIGLVIGTVLYALALGYVLVRFQSHATDGDGKLITALAAAAVGFIWGRKKSDGSDAKSADKDAS